MCTKKVRHSLHDQITWAQKRCPRMPGLAFGFCYVVDVAGANSVVVLHDANTLQIAE